MVFCTEPYYNEPGWERDRGTAKGDASVLQYNKRVAHDTAVHAIEAPLKAPLKSPHGVFADVLDLHWRNKRAAIARCMERWDVPAAVRQRVRL